MALLDLILNLAGLLLWFGWRAIGIDRGARPAALSLASTLKRAEPQHAKSWLPLAFLLLLLLLRSLLYWQLGPSAHWTPTLDLGVVTFPFRADYLTRVLLFSGLSFLRALVVVHLWLLLLVIAGNRDASDDPVLAMVRAQFGWLARIPSVALILLVPLFGALVWIALDRSLSSLGLATPLPAISHWQQAGAFGLSLFLVWKPAAVVLLAVHGINTYVYLGNSPTWECVARCGRNLVRWLPLSFGKVDLAPWVGVSLVLFSAHFAEQALITLFTRPL